MDSPQDPGTSPPPSSASTTPGGKSAAERRRHPRTAEDRPAWLHRGSNSASIEMIDISPGGACFLSPRPLQIGKSLRLQVGHGASQTTLDGVIVRQVQRPDGQYEIGLRVDNLHGFELSQRFPTRGRMSRY